MITFLMGCTRNPHIQMRSILMPELCIIHLQVRLLVYFVLDYERVEMLFSLDPHKVLVCDFAVDP